MSREIYAAVSGATAAWSHLDVVSHNLANMSTNGYKARTVSFQVAADSRPGVLGGSYVEPRPGASDLGDGPIQRTGNPLDLALRGEGFFAVETSGGEQLLTRNGSFVQDPDGFVVTRDGLKLLSSAGPVQLQPGEGLIVQENGGLRSTLGGDLGFLQVLSGEVEPVGDTLFRAKGATEDVVQAQLSLAPGEAPKVRVQQEHLEGSNVDPMMAMVELTEASRYFEVYQNMMKASDEADSRLVMMGRS
jgi:flagellar basal body rod protein FlgG